MQADTIQVPNPLRERTPQFKSVRTPSGSRYDSYREDRVSALRSLRDDPLARMHQRRQINEAQYAAGREFQRLHEAAEIGKIGSPDYSQEPVDGGNRIPEPITDAQQRAARALRALWPTLGMEGSAILTDFLIARLDLRQLAIRRGEEPTKRAQLYFGRRLRECLTTLAGAFHLA